jgi:protein TonB
MGKKKEYHDEEHKPFAVLLASKPPADKGRTRSTLASLVIHGALGTFAVWATIAAAEEVTDQADDVVTVEMVAEVEVPPPPPPPPPPDMPVPVVDEVFKGFQTLEIPPVIPPDIPPPSQMTEFKASDFTGEGVAGGRGTGTRVADANVSSVEPQVDRNTPSFTPMTIRPRLTNQPEVERALVREYPPILRDAGIGGTVEVWLYINTEGAVENAKVNKGSGYSQMDDAALKVGQTMKFTPAFNRDLKVPVWVSIPVTFRIG